FRQSDLDYLAATPPEMIAFPDELKDGLPENWREICDGHPDWSCLPFTSKSLPNPPALSFGRLLIVARGPDFDRWMLFTVPEKRGKKVSKEHLIDFIGVEKTQVIDGSIQKREKPLLHFVEYWRDRKGGNPVYRKQLASCYKCHPSGMRDIVPAIGSVDEAGATLAKDLNREMRRYGGFDLGGAFDPADYGPPMGDAQSCTKCHDGKPGHRGILNAAHLGERSRHQIYFKMVHDLSMPPGAAGQEVNAPLFDAFKMAMSLTPEQRSKLYRPRPVSTGLKLLDLTLGDGYGPMARSNRSVLRFLRKQNLLTKEEQEAAVAVDRRLAEEMDAEFTEMQRQYFVELQSWLRGGREECRTLFP
ncbi:MAG: hypothetical protein AAB425_03445, partial [Bdellovibrionota bacterium]